MTIPFWLALEEQLELVELLVFLADLFESVPAQIDEALVAFVGAGGFDAACLASDAIRLADRVAVTLGLAGARAELPR